MGSHFKALTVNMKTFLLALTLLMLVLHGSKADKVTSCLQCQSATGMEDSECIKGTGKGTACATDAVGCVVNVVSGTAMGVDVATWTRGCCTVDAQCTEMHEESEVGGVSGMVDQIGCTTNDCNTMDPRTGSSSTTTTSNSSGSTTDSSSASTLVPALTVLLAIVAVMA